MDVLIVLGLYSLVLPQLYVLWRHSRPSWKTRVRAPRLTTGRVTSSTDWKGLV